MKGLQATGMLVLLGTSIFFIKNYHAYNSMIYPDQCIFEFDDQLSTSFQKELREHICKQHKAQSFPETIIAQVMDKYGEIVDMQAQMCNPDSLCFSLQAAKPLFKVNDRLLCDNYRITNQDHYHADCIVDLDGIKAEEKSNLRHIVLFFQQVPADLYKEFDIHWKSDSEIILKSKDDDILFFSHEQKPQWNDIALFKEIKQELKHKKGKKTKKSFDFRFENQIVVK